MTISPRISHTHSPIPADIHDSCELVQVLMKLQRAAQPTTFTSGLVQLVERGVNGPAATVGCVEVSGWWRASGAEEMVLQGMRGRTVREKCCRLKIGSEGMVFY